MKNKIIESNELYIIESTITGQPYLSEECECFVFVRKIDAEEFLINKADLKITGPKKYDIDKLCSSLFALGAITIRINSEGRISSCPLGERYLKKQFYNNSLNANLNLLKELKLKKYIKKLHLCSFIVPIKIKNHEKIEMLYGTVSVPNSSDYMFLAFSDLEEYNKWEAKVTGWQALLISGSELKRIGKKHGVMINPLGNRLVLDVDTLCQIRNVNEEEEETS